MIPGSNQLHSLATKYSKPQLQQMAQMGEISPLDAVMAGMMIDRVVLSANKPPESTVADDVFAPKTQMAGVAPGNGAQEAPGLAQAPQSTADISKAYGGLMSIPRPGEKYNQDNFATGGIVAFDEGGRVEQEAWEKYKAAHEKARGPEYGDKPIYDSQVPFFGSLPGIIGNPEIPHDAVSNPAAFAVTAPTSTVGVETQKQLAKVQPAAAPAGPLAAMAQAAPASDEFAQQGANLMKLPTRTPTNTTGLIDTPEEIAKDKEDILNSTIGYAGAEIMAGKSQFAMTNIGEGLSKAFASYAQRIGEHKKLRKSDIKDFATITQADEALKAGDVKTALHAWSILSSDKTRAESAKEIATMQVGAQDRATNATRGATQAYRDDQQYGINVRNAETEFDKFRTNLAKKLAPGGSLWKQSQADPSLESTLENAERIRLGRVHKLPGYADAVEKAAPPIGAVVDGYTFKGGNPKLKESWTKS